MTPAELIQLAKKHNILVPIAYRKDSFAQTYDWTDEKWERFMEYTAGYDPKSEDAIIQSIENFEEEDPAKWHVKQEVIVDPERVWDRLDEMPRFYQWKVALHMRAYFLINGIPIGDIIVRGLTDRQLEVLGRFVSKCKKSD